MNEKKKQKKGAQGKDGFFFDDGRLRLIFDEEKKNKNVLSSLFSLTFLLFFFSD